MKQQLALDFRPAIKHKPPFTGRGEEIDALIRAQVGKKRQIDYSQFYWWSARNRYHARLIMDYMLSKGWEYDRCNGNFLKNGIEAYYGEKTLTFYYTNYSRIFTRDRVFPSHHIIQLFP